MAMLNNQMVYIYRYMMIYVTLWEINIDPENHQFLEETNLPTPIYQGLC
jgi:hypothetical protein